MGEAYFTVFEGVTLVATEMSKFRGKPLGPCIELSFPDSEWDRMTIYRPFPSQDEAKVAAKTLTDQLKGLRPKDATGFLPGLSARKPTHAAAREQIEAIARDWAGPVAFIYGVNA